jgi:hypothetical protein
MMRLWLEFLLLYVALPALLLAVRLCGVNVPVLPVLWAAAYPAARYLARRHGWGAREFVGLRLSRWQAGHLILRAALAAAVLVGGLWLYDPGMLFDLPQRSPRLWGLVMLFYPLLSVYPQGVLYRGLFYARYAALFGSEARAWLACAAAFSLAHLVFANAWALALTFVGGLFIARTYRRTGSLMASDLEHALYGQLVFTAGWGRFLYHGTVRLLERGLS